MLTLLKFFFCIYLMMLCLTMAGSFIKFWIDTSKYRKKINDFEVELEEGDPERGERDAECSERDT